MPKPVYVMVGGNAAELIRINGANPEGKYCVHVKGTDKPAYVSEIGMKISKHLYDEFKPLPTKQPAKRGSKKL